MTYPLPTSGPGSDLVASPAANVRVVVCAALLTFTAGMLVLVGWLLLDGFFGALLGIVAAVFAGVFWKNKNTSMMPANPPVKSVVLLGVVAAVLGLITFLLV